MPDPIPTLDYARASGRPKRVTPPTVFFAAGVAVWAVVGVVCGHLFDPEMDVLCSTIGFCIDVLIAAGIFRIGQAVRFYFSYARPVPRPRWFLITLGFVTTATALGVCLAVDRISNGADAVVIPVAFGVCWLVGGSAAFTSPAG